MFAVPGSIPSLVPSDGGSRTSLSRLKPPFPYFLFFFLVSSSYPLRSRTLTCPILSLHYHPLLSHLHRGIKYHFSMSPRHTLFLLPFIQPRQGKLMVRGLVMVTYIFFASNTLFYIDTQPDATMSTQMSWPCLQSISRAECAFIS